jgi:serine/threonine protein kinase
MKKESDLFEYKIKRLIGKGCFGCVYQANKNEKNFAIKVISLEKNKENEELNIIKNIKNYKHKNIVKFYDYYIVDRKTLISFLGKPRFYKLEKKMISCCEYEDACCEYYEDYFGVIVMEKIKDKKTKYTKKDLITIYKLIVDLLAKGIKPYDLHSKNIGELEGKIKIYDIGLFDFKKKLENPLHSTILKYLNDLIEDLNQDENLTTLEAKKVITVLKKYKTKKSDFVINKLNEVNCD